MAVFHKQRRNLFLIKETTPGTYQTTVSTFVAANAKLPVTNLKVKIQNKEIERYIDRNSLDSIQSIFYGEEAEISFDSYIYGSGTAGTVIGTADNGFDLLMKCAFHTGTVNAATSVVYTLNASSLVRMSAGVEFISEDGTTSYRWAIKGAAVTSMKVDLQVGAHGVIHWVLKGPIAYESSVPVAGIAGTPVSSIVRDTMIARTPQFKGLAFTVGGVARLISKLSIDYGLATEYETDISDPTTYQRVILGARKPTITIDPETTPKATVDDFGEFFAGTSPSSTSVVLGTTAGQIFTWLMPKLQRSKADFGERGVITTTETTFRCNSSTDAGEDSITLTLT